jgi:hypothetical protein
MNLSLHQSLPPSKNPTKAGGFKGSYATNPSRLNSKDPLDISSTKNGPSTKLLVDLERAQSPTALQRRINMSKEVSQDLASSWPYPAFDPSTSQTLKTVRQTQTSSTIIAGEGDPSPQRRPQGSKILPQIGGLGGQMLQNRSLESLAVAFLPREEQACQTAPELLKIDFEDLNAYKAWTKEEIDPLFKDLRKNLLNERPQDVGVYLEAYGRALQRGDPLPVCVLEEEIYSNEPPESPTRDSSLNQSLKTTDKIMHARK